MPFKLFEAAPAPELDADVDDVDGPADLVEEVVQFLRTKGFNNIQELEVMPENVRFGLPPEIVQAIASAPPVAR